MNDKEFVQYVNDKRRQGMSDSQIARSLGMSLAHMMGKLNVSEKKTEAPKAAPVFTSPTPAPVKEEKVEKPEKKFQPKKQEKAEEPVKTSRFFEDKEFDD